MNVSLQGIKERETASEWMNPSDCRIQSEQLCHVLVKYLDHIFIVVVGKLPVNGSDEVGCYFYRLDGVTNFIHVLKLDKDGYIKWSGAIIEVKMIDGNAFDLLTNNNPELLI